MKSKTGKIVMIFALIVFMINIGVTSTNLSLTSTLGASAPMLLWSYGTGGDILDVKSIPDVNGDGNPDVAVGSADNNVYVLDGVSGTKIWNKLTLGDVPSVDHIEDITGDGIIEVVAGSVDTKAYMLNGANGVVIWAEPLYTYNSPIYRVQGIEDVTGDGKQDIVAGGMAYNDHEIECKNGTDGIYHWIEWSTSVQWRLDDFTILSDVTEDGKPDVVWAYGYYGQYMNLINGVTGDTVVYRVDLPIHDMWVSLVMIPDISGDGYEDVVNIRVDTGVSSGARALVLSGPSLEEIWRFEKSAVASDERMWDANYISDITMDGRPEIAIGWKDKVFLLSGVNGLEIWNVTLDGGNSAYSRSHRITEGRDISGDGVDDIVVGVQNGKVHFLSGLNGSPIQDPYQVGGPINSVAYMDDVTGDSVPEVLVGSTDNFIYCLALQEEPPEFESVSWTPTSPPPFVYSLIPREGEPVDVEANVSDASGIDRVLFYYKINEGNWWNTSMNYNAITGLWNVTIPGQPGEATVEFFLEAFDNIGNKDTSAPYTYTVEALTPGDINGDGKVDVSDLFELSKKYGEVNP